MYGGVVHLLMLLVILVSVFVATLWCSPRSAADGTIGVGPSTTTTRRRSRRPATVAAVFLVAVVTITVASSAVANEIVASRVTSLPGIGASVLGDGSPTVLARSDRSGRFSVPSRSFVATEAVPGASNTANGARLNEQLRLTERYGAGGVRELSDGREPAGLLHQVRVGVGT